MSLDWSSPKAVHPLAGDVAAASSSLSTRSIRSRKSSVDPQTLPSAEHPRPGLSRFDAATSLLAFESNGKARTSFDGLTRAGTEDEAEREVVVHQLSKTDTIASVALQYGITPQQLRLANRLWPSDSVHLRRVLHIPLDQCHLPSSSSIERVSREEDGNLIVWAREPLQRRTTSSSLDGSTTDLLGAWEDTSGRSSLDSFRDPMVRANGKGKAPALLIDGEEIEELDAVSGYLPKTNNPYSFSAPPSPPLRNDLFGLYSPFNPSSAPTLALRTSEPPDPHSGPSSSTDSLGSNSSRPSPSSAGTLSRRTLTVERVPSSSLSFFPPPNPAFSNSSSTRSSYEETRSSIDEQALNSMFSGGSSTTRHTINTVAKSSGRTKKFSLTPVTTAWSALAAGVASASDPVSSTTSSTGVDERQPGWMARWDLSYFGGEEEVELTAPGGETWRMPESSRGPQYAGAGAAVTRSHTVKARREPRPE